MQLIESVNNIKKPFKNPVITIGNFDGVHLGHQALFQMAIKKAGELEGTSVAVTFEPHPIRVLKQNGHPPLITLYEQKVELIEGFGLDVLVCILFTRKFADVTAREFVEDILVERIGMKAIVVGEDYTFGKNREGSLDFLKSEAERFKFEVIQAKWVPAPNGLSGRISSTRVRELVLAGEVDHARRLLGRYYQIRGKVMSGRDRGGKILGFPTANILLNDELCPKMGVYAVFVECLGKRYKGVANIGYSPTFDDHQYSVEVYILNFNENIYGQKIRVNFVHRIRDEKKFSGVKELSEQIEKDVVEADNLLA